MHIVRIKERTSLEVLSKNCFPTWRQTIQAGMSTTPCSSKRFNASHVTTLDAVKLGEKLMSAGCMPESNPKSVMRFWEAVTVCHCSPFIDATLVHSTPAR